jgi:feruloyl-CoA synthase
VQDIVVTGHGRDAVGALVFPNVEACRGLCPDLAAGAPVEQVLVHEAVRARFQGLLDGLAAEATGSSTRITRAMLLHAPAAIDTGEITDKGSINQRAVLSHRADLVTALYAEPPREAVLCAKTSQRGVRE